MLLLSDVDAIEAAADQMLAEPREIDFPIRPGDILRDAGHIVRWHQFAPSKQIDCYTVRDTQTGDAVIFVNKQLREHYPRLRFSLAHELGHLHLRRLGLVHTEEAADEFAACLLMPRGEFTLTWRECRADRFGVSPTAACVRQTMLLDRFVRRIAPLDWRPRDRDNNRNIAKGIVKTAVALAKCNEYFEPASDCPWLEFTYPII